MGQTALRIIGPREMASSKIKLYAKRARAGRLTTPVRQPIVSAADIAIIIGTSADYIISNSKDAKISVYYALQGNHGYRAFVDATWQGVVNRIMKLRSQQPERRLIWCNQNLPMRLLPTEAMIVLKCISPSWGNITPEKMKGLMAYHKLKADGFIVKWRLLEYMRNDIKYSGKKQSLKKQEQVPKLAEDRSNLEEVIKFLEQARGDIVGGVVIGGLIGLSPSSVSHLVADKKLKVSVQSKGNRKGRHVPVFKARPSNLLAYLKMHAHVLGTLHAQIKRLGLSINPPAMQRHIANILRQNGGVKRVDYTYEDGKTIVNYVAGVLLRSKQIAPLERAKRIRSVWQTIFGQQMPGWLPTASTQDHLNRLNGMQIPQTIKDALRPEIIKLGDEKRFHAAMPQARAAGSPSSMPPRPRSDRAQVTYELNAEREEDFGPEIKPLSESEKRELARQREAEFNPEAVKDPESRIHGEILKLIGTNISRKPLSNIRKEVGLDYEQMADLFRQYKLEVPLLLRIKFFDGERSSRAINFPDNKVLVPLSAIAEQLKMPVDQLRKSLAAAKVRLYFGGQTQGETPFVDIVAARSKIDYLKRF